jgi:T5SS/PEP-CTERM-associated repeat protein/autotransporter-associated beta strand protein
VTVSSGTWANNGFLFIGFDGTGTLNITGGSVTNTVCFLGYDPGSVGAATVSSGTWANSGDLFVGYSGTGTLTVNGGSVTNSNGYLGYEAGSVGTATVSSGTWANSGDLDVGESGTGTLTITGGVVSVAGTLSTGRYGTINIGNGGTTGVLLGGTGSVVNDGTLVFNRSDDSTYSGSITGSGSVTKQGGGRLTLAGPNAYSGRTTISGGTLALSGSGSIGTGGLDLGTNGIFDLAALASATYSLPATGNLSGVGTLAGTGKTLAVLGSFLPGNSPGTVTLGSGLSLDLSSSGTSVFQITSPLYTAGSFDLVNGTGSVIFGGILSLDFSGGSYARGTNVVQIFANIGGFTGDFSSVVWTGLADGQTASFNAATGFITIVPEPSTCAMALAGLACGGYSMFRRRRVR